MAPFKDDLTEFRAEADRLLAECERGLDAVAEGGLLSESFEPIYRAFHKLRGAAGILNLRELQDLMDSLETTLAVNRAEPTLHALHVDLFRRGTATARVILDCPALKNYSSASNSPASTSPTRA